MATYIVHVSVDAADATRAVKMIRECITYSSEVIECEDGEIAVVLDNPDVIED